MEPQRVIGWMKLVILATWLLGGAAAFLLPPESGLGQAGRTLVSLLVIVHLLEFGFFFKVLRQTGRPLPLEFAQTLTFGVVRYLEARLEIEARSGEQGP